MFALLTKYWRDILIGIGLVVIAIIGFGYLQARYEASRHQQEREKAIAEADALRKQADITRTQSAIIAERARLKSEQSEEMRVESERRIRLLEEQVKELTKFNQRILDIKASLDRTRKDIAETPDNEQLLQMCLEYARAGVSLDVCQGGSDE